MTALVDLARVAGMLDGTGTMVLQRHYRGDSRVLYLTAVVRLRLRDHATAHLLAADWGGVVHTNHDYSTRWIWEVTGFAAEEMLAQVRPWLSGERQDRVALITQLADIRDIEDVDERHEARIALWNEWTHLLHPDEERA